MGDLNFLGFCLFGLDYFTSEFIAQAYIHEISITYSCKVEIHVLEGLPGVIIRPIPPKMDQTV